MASSCSRTQHAQATVLADKPRCIEQLVRVAAAWCIVAACLGIAALTMPGVAGAHRGDGVFTIAEAGWLHGGGDVARLPDGSIVVGKWLLAPDGRRSPIPGFRRAFGLAATADGGLLAMGDDAIQRWTPGLGVTTVAGTGKKGFAGDGGPASGALLNFELRGVGGPPSGIVTRPDGGFVFTDTGNRRIRAVDSAGIISTIAGASAGTLTDPVALSATPDSGYLVVESYGRVKRVAAGGTIKTVARITSTDVASDVVVSADGTAFIAESPSGHLWRLEPGSQTPRPYLRPPRPTDTFDFAARAPFGTFVGLDAYGGMLAVGPTSPVITSDGYVRNRGALRYVADGPTPWTMAALRSTRTSRHAVTAVIEATQPGMATLEIARGKLIVARVRQPVPAGHSTMRAVGPVRKRWYDVRLRLEGPGGATARDDVPVHGARALTARLVRRLLGQRQGIDDETRYTLGSDCRRFGKRRVDCEIDDAHGSKVGIASVKLARSGVVLRRHYRWGQHGFRRHPRYLASDGVQPLSRRYRGLWGEPEFTY